MRKFFDLSQSDLAPFIQGIDKNEGNQDVVVGLRQDFINKAIKSVFDGVYPTLFKGLWNYPKINLCFDWDMNVAPHFEFKCSTVAQQDFHDYCSQTYKLQQNHTIDDELSSGTDNFIAEFLESSKTIAIALTIPSVKLKLTKTDDKKYVERNFKLMLSCYFSIETSDNGDSMLSIVPFAGRIEDAKGISEILMELMSAQVGNEYPLSDIVYLFINEILLPFALNSCKGLIPKIKIPQPEYKGINIQNYSIDFKENYLLVATQVINKTSKNTKISNEPFELPNRDVFISINDRAFGAVADTLLSMVQDALKNVSFKGSGYAFRINAMFDDPSPKISLEDSKIRINTGLDASAVGIVGWWIFQMPVAGIIFAKKPINIDFVPEIIDNKVYIHLKNTSEIELDIEITPKNLIMRLIDFSIKILKALVPDFIVRTLKSTLDKIPVLTLSSIEFEMVGIEAKCAIEKAATEIKNKKLSAASNLNLTVKRTVKDRLLSNEKLAPGEAIVSGNGIHTLQYTEKGEIIISNVLTGETTWKASTWGTPNNPKELIMQKDGNLVAYGVDNKPYWATATDKNEKSYAVLGDNGVLVIYNKDSKIIWQSL